MSYSNIGIINLALIRIGVKTISSLTENSPQAITANAVLEYMRDEVLETKDWRFAKTRYKLAQSTTSPLSVWKYAYPLPTDFLRLSKGREDDPSIYPNTSESDYPWVIETLDDGTMCLLTNYDNSYDDLYIVYIRRITDPSKYSALFIKALAYRLAAEIAISRTETAAKFSSMINLYQVALTEADVLNSSMDSVEYELGTDSWESAGR